MSKPEDEAMSIENGLSDEMMQVKLYQLTHALRSLFDPNMNLTIVMRQPGDCDGLILTDEESPMEVEQLIQTLRRFSGH